MIKTKRVTQMEYRQRVDMMTALLARGLPYSHMVRIAQDQWGVSERQAKRYIQMAKGQEKRFGTQPMVDQYSQVIGKFIYIYSQAIHHQDLELARRTTRDMMKWLAQAKRELSDEEFQSCQSRLVESGHLEEVVRALAKEGKNYPVE